MHAVSVHKEKRNEFLCFYARNGTHPMCVFQQATQMTQCDNGLLHPCCLPMLNKDDHCVACWKAHYGCVQGDAIRVI